MKNWFNRLRDTVDEVVHDVTEPLLRCTSTNDDGRRCVHDKGHSTPHQEAGGETW